MGLKPPHNPRPVRGADPKARPKVGRREPLLIERRTGIVLGREQRIQCALLRRRRSQQKHHPRQPRLGLRLPLVKLGPRQ